MADSPDVSAWLSTAASVAAALIAMATLFTVYMAMLQLATQNRMYKLGLSRRAVGPWEPQVTNSALLGLRRRIYAPAVSLNSLVEKQWKPRFTFPHGFPERSNTSVEEASNVQAKASWVNFMQALGLSPEHSDLYEMQDASELVNDVVPMPWTGKDLVGICSILGFQSHEKKPSSKSPMPLPMQWSGPLGWVQFRSSASGCVAEFRRRMETSNQIPDALHRHWQSYDVPGESYLLRSRLWNSIGGFYLPDGRVLFLGGSDKHEGPRDQDPEDVRDRDQTQLLNDLTSSDLSGEDIMLRLYGKKKDRPRALQRGAERNEPTQARRAGNDSDIPDFIESILREKLNSDDQMEVLRPCPGLLSVIVNGELAYSRGLAMKECEEYDRRYTDKEDVDIRRYPYNLGDLYMDKDLLLRMKEALLLLKPDGFYFSPTYVLYADILEAYKHVQEQSNKVMQIYPDTGEESLQGASPEELLLHHAMRLCNELQRKRKAERAVFSVDDMRLLAKASFSLKPIISLKEGDNGRDLVWAMMYCPDISRCIRESLSPANMSQFLAAKVHCRDGWLVCDSLPLVHALESEKVTRYRTPLVAEGEYTGTQILAALSDVFITYYWIEKRWITDVAMYDTTIPQSVTMC